MGCTYSSKVAAPDSVAPSAEGAEGSRPEELESTATWEFPSPPCHKRNEASPVKPSPLSVKSQGSEPRFRSTSPFRLTVFSASTERSLPGDSAFLWGSPQVLFPRLQQQVRDCENLYDSDSEGEITRSSPLRLPKSAKSAKSAFGSNISFLWSASQKCFQDAKIASDRWAHPPERRVPTFQGEVLQRTFEREAEGERFDTPDEQRRLQKLAARACEVKEVLRPKLHSENDLAQVGDQVSRAIHFIAESLPHAAETLGVQPSGLVFQALLLRAGLGRGNLALSVELEPILGEGKAEKLAGAARELCELLRVKVEDDGDLSLAMTVLEDCKRFFRALAVVAQGKGISSFQLLEDLMMKVA